jgi:transposase
LTTKIHALVDALGNPFSLMLTPGQDHDLTCAEPPLETADPRVLIGDKAYDADPLISTLDGRAIIPVIPPKANRKIPVIPPKANRKVKRDCDFVLYCERNLVERFFNRIKHYRGIATRYDKLARNFLAAVQLVAAIMREVLSVVRHHDVIAAATEFLPLGPTGRRVTNEDNPPAAPARLQPTPSTRLQAFQRITSAPVVMLVALTLADMDRYPDEARARAEWLMAVHAPSPSASAASRRFCPAIAALCSSNPRNASCLAFLLDQRDRHYERSTSFAIAASGSPSRRRSAARRAPMTPASLSVRSRSVITRKRHG